MQWRGSEIDRSRAERTAALASVAVLCALAIWLTGRLVWLAVPRSDSGSATAPRIGAPTPAATVSISKWHLFGDTPARSGTSPDAPVTQLGLVLRGTLADSDANAGIAVIDRGLNGEHAYRVGEEIVPGVKLARVYADRIVVLHDGREESLALPRDSDLTPADVVRKPAPGRSRRAAAGDRADPAHAAAGAPRAVPPTVQETLQRFRDHPEELAERVQVVPVLDDGKLAGVRVSSGTDVALLDALGLRPGDIVTAIDGQPVDSVARGREIVQRLGRAASARVTVLRNGKPTDVTISLK